MADAADHRISVGGGTIDVAITGAEPVPTSAMLRWIDTAARAVTAYFGRYPVPHVGGRVTFDDGATLAPVRRAIVAERAGDVASGR